MRRVITAANAPSEGDQVSWLKSNPDAFAGLVKELRDYPAMRDAIDAVCHDRFTNPELTVNCLARLMAERYPVLVLVRRLEAEGQRVLILDKGEGEGA